jgi:hypothetical protein
MDNNPLMNAFGTIFPELRGNIYIIYVIHDIGADDGHLKPVDFALSKDVAKHKASLYNTGCYGEIKFDLYDCDSSIEYKFEVC